MCYGTGVVEGISCTLSESDIIDVESLLLSKELSGLDYSSLRLSTLGGVALIKKGST
jgi:hypothetical protein